MANLRESERFTALRTRCEQSECSAQNDSPRHIRVGSDFAFSATSRVSLEQTDKEIASRLACLYSTHDSYNTIHGFVPRERVRVSITRCYYRARAEARGAAFRGRLSL